MKTEKKQDFNERLEQKERRKKHRNSNGKVKEINQSHHEKSKPYKRNSNMHDYKNSDAYDDVDRY